MIRREFIAALGAAAIVVGAVSAAVNGSVGGPVPIFRQDLQPFGYVIKANGSTANHFDLNFLAEDLLLVSANVRAVTQQAEPLFTEGRGNFLLFDISRKLLIRRAEQMLSADSNVVRATRDGKFVALGLSGVSLCSSDLTCSVPLPTRGPIVVSPDGRMLVVGGNGQTARRVLESGTFKEIASFPWNSEDMQVGDNAILFGGSDLAVISGSKQEHRFVSLDAHPQFLNGDLVAGYTERAHEPKELVTQALDGTVRYETVLESSWYETKIIPATNGKRFCIDEVGYDKFSLPNLLGYGDVPYHFERVRVLETEGGKQLFELRWDPRPYTGYMVSPAISPDGHRVAIVRHGFVEVFGIP